ncbi:phage virion morphogenesis protein [Paenirhodobacter ferrireducens]|nr:phage virion morphogenesis protein [Sinirhodobacter ferrireducens]
MPENGFTIEVNDREASEALAALLRRMEERRGFYQNVAELLASSSRENFRKQTAPSGTPWAKLKAATIRERTRKGQLPLTILNTNGVKDGIHLQAAISQDADNDAARVGVLDQDPVRHYAAIHQFGGTIPIPARKGRIYRHYDPTTGVTGRKFVSPKSDGARATEVDIAGYMVTMPARPYLGVSAEDEMEIMLLAEDWIGL